jgi:hypothetical protein
MIQIFDGVLDGSSSTIDSSRLAQVCENHAALNERSPSWVNFENANGFDCSPHGVNDQEVISEYLRTIVRPLVHNYRLVASGAEWWCNMNNQLGWHVDKDEAWNKVHDEIRCPLLSTVYYPVADCYGGELLLLDVDSDIEIQARVEYSCPEYDPSLISRITRVPAKRNRLVVFSPGMVHRVNPFVGERYSLAVNIWQDRPVMNCVHDLDDINAFDARD